MNDATARKQAARGINPDSIKKVIRIALKKGFRFEDQDGNVLRKQATRAYTHMAVNTWSDGAKALSFHSTSRPTPTYKSLTILRVIEIEPQEKVHEPINQTALTVGLAQTRKSIDPSWQKVAVIYPSKPTEWYDTEEEAERVKGAFNGSSL